MGNMYWYLLSTELKIEIQVQNTASNKYTPSVCRIIPWRKPYPASASLLMQVPRLDRIHVLSKAI